MTTSRRRWKTLTALALAGALLPLAASADDSRRAVRKADAPSAHHGTAARSAPAQRPPSTAARSPRATATGRATYGHGGYHPWGWWWYDRWYPSWSIDLTWGWGWGWGWYGGWGPWWGGPSYYGYGPGYGPGYGVAPEMPAMEIGPALVEVDVIPRRATVRLDGEDVGRAKDYDGRWDRLPLASGSHTVELEAPGYKTLRVNVDARQGGRYRIAYELERGEGIDPRSNPERSAEPAAPAPPATSATPAPAGGPAPPPAPTLAKGFLKLRVVPEDAAVYLDGAYLARGEELSRLRGAVPVVAGSHVVEVVRPGYASRRVDVDVSRGEPSSVEVTLEREK